MEISSTKFKLDERFIERFVGQEPVWGPIGKITYARTYARSIPSTPARIQSLAKKHKLPIREEYWLTLVRVVEGTYRIQEAHCKQLRLPWNGRKAQLSAQEMYRLMWEFKFLPPGRGLWMMGTDYVIERGGACLNNCSAVSTEDIRTSFSDPFVFLMDMSMLGVGVGGDTRGATLVTIKQPRQTSDTHVVEDSREGWTEIVRRYLDAYVTRDTIPEHIDFSKVRPAGVPLKGFGGVASGPAPLAELLIDIQNILNPLIGEPITSTAIVDLFNVIGRCVVAGNIRRSASVMFGSPDDRDFLELKDATLYPEQCKHHRWASNNSLIAKVGMDYSVPAQLAAKYGEPGFFWLGNAQDYGRLIDPPDYKDAAAVAANPCLEQTLENMETCCLVETFPTNHESYDEFERTLKFAYLYAKTVTLLPTHNERTNAVMMRNRRIGTSMSGIVQAFKRHGRNTMRTWADNGYKYLKGLDRVYSRWLCIPESIKITSLKPSGTVSLLPGVTPGIHYPHSEYYHRVIRFSSDSDLLPKLKRAGYRCVELSPDKEPNTTAVYFAVQEKYFDRAKSEVSIWEQLENAALFQSYWSDNQVSCTITFTEEEASEIPYALEIFETRLKGISFLPLKHGYEHAPFQEISAAEYATYMSGLKELDLSDTENELLDTGCSGDTCLLPK